ASGRGPAYRIRVGEGAPAVVRICRRGGLAARLARETYLGLRPRPLRELALTVEARRRGVAAAEVLAARVEGRLAYRGALVTAEVPEAATLIEALRAAPDGTARRGLAAAAGRAVAGLHAAGVFHADLNLRNILVHAGPEGVRAALLDFDRAWLGTAPLRPHAPRLLPRLGGGAALGAAPCRPPVARPRARLRAAARRPRAAAVPAARAPRALPGGPRPRAGHQERAHRLGLGCQRAHRLRAR